MSITLGNHSKTAHENSQEDENSSDCIYYPLYKTLAALGDLHLKTSCHNSTQIRKFNFHS